MSNGTGSRFAIWRFFAELPSTNVRIAASILMALATGVRVVALGWEPSYEWLGFLVLWAGLDVAQFGVKRTTDAGHVAAKQGIPPSDEPKPPEPGV
jgi:hypothetical protein